jgi:hypothetical protein
VTATENFNFSLAIHPCARHKYSRQGPEFAQSDHRQLGECLCIPRVSDMANMMPSEVIKCGGFNLRFYRVSLELTFLGIIIERRYSSEKLFLRPDQRHGLGFHIFELPSFPPMQVPYKGIQVHNGDIAMA